MTTPPRSGGHAARVVLPVAPPGLAGGRRPGRLLPTAGSVTNFEQGLCTGIAARRRVCCLGTGRFEWPALMEREFELELVDAALAGFFGDFEAPKPYIRIVPQPNGKD